MFATGIENSIPTINDGRTRVDEMEKCGHYKHWRTDFDLVEELGIRFLRYGPPLHTTWLGPGRYDWAFADVTFARSEAARHRADRRSLPFRRAGLDRQLPEPRFPGAVRRLCRAFAQRFPWVQLYTPVNEMFICATSRRRTAGGTSS